LEDFHSDWLIWCSNKYFSILGRVCKFRQVASFERESSRTLMINFKEKVCLRTRETCFTFENISCILSRWMFLRFSCCTKNQKCMFAIYFNRIMSWWLRWVLARMYWTNLFVFGDKSLADENEYLFVFVYLIGWVFLVRGNFKLIFFNFP
jgi:hypothetical protein